MYVWYYTICIYIGPSDDNQNIFTHELRGVIPRSFEYLFSLINREKLKVHVHVIKYLISSSEFPFLMFKLSISFFSSFLFPVILLFIHPISCYSNSFFILHMYPLLLLFIHPISYSSSSFIPSPISSSYLLLLLFILSPVTPLYPISCYSNSSSYLLLLLFILSPVTPTLPSSYLLLPQLFPSHICMYLCYCVFCHSSSLLLLFLYMYSPLPSSLPPSLPLSLLPSPLPPPLPPSLPSLSPSFPPSLPPSLHPVW